MQKTTQFVSNAQRVSIVQQRVFPPPLQSAIQAISAKKEA